MKIWINRARITGPTLTFWALETGYEVLLIEHSPHNCEPCLRGKME